MTNIFKKILFVSMVAAMMMGCSESDNTIDEADAADLVVYGKIYTSETNDLHAEAFAVKDGKYIYVGSKEGASAYINKNKTKIVDYTDKGLVMPSCGNGHAHYLMGFGLNSIGANIGAQDDVDKFFKIVESAADKARANKSVAIMGIGWNYHIFVDNMPTRQQLDSICSDIPIYFADEEGHKGLVNTLALQVAGIMREDGSVVEEKTKIRGGEVVMDSNKKPTGLLLEQAGTYVREKFDNDNFYTVDVASKNIEGIEEMLLSEGYTMYLDGWSNYFFNDNFYKAAKQIDEESGLHFMLGLSHEIESWMDVSSSLEKASATKEYASKHILPRWIKLFVDGTVEGGSGYCAKPYPDGHEGIVNWSEQELTKITSEANAKGITMHAHTMGDMAVNLAINAYINGGRDEMRNTIVHVRNVLPTDWQRMADHNISSTVGILWHHYHVFGPLLLKYYGLVPEGYEEMSYPMKSYFDYGINMTSHTDYPALSESPDDPFGIMEIAVTGIMARDRELPWWTAELITREQALQVLTINCAKQMFIENERGSIKVGKYADFLLVDKDVLTCLTETIHEAKPAATYFEGKKVYGTDFEK